MWVGDLNKDPSEGVTLVFDEDSKCKLREFFGENWSSKADSITHKEHKSVPLNLTLEGVAKEGNELLSRVLKLEMYLGEHLKKTEDRITALERNIEAAMPYQVKQD